MPRPALLTGTSSEFIGNRPLPKVVRSRRVAFFMGPRGVGKSTVAQLVAGAGHVRLDAQELKQAILFRVGAARWPPAIDAARTLVLDGPVWLRNRVGALQLLADLARERAERRLRTMFCEVDQDGSLQPIISMMEAGRSVVVVLRFPDGRRARVRCARRICRSLGLPEQVAEGSDQLSPWSYDRLTAWLVERPWSDDD